MLIKMVMGSFSSEAFLTKTADCPACFPDAFLAYINTLSNWSKTLTPGAGVKKFVSPYGTMRAQATAPFIAQLQHLNVDVVACKKRFSRFVALPVSLTWKVLFLQTRTRSAASGTLSL